MQYPQRLAIPRQIIHNVHNATTSRDTLPVLWIKAFHVIFMVTWFAGLFYLPRLYVYHAAARDTISLDRFILMEKRLFWGIMAPGALLTLGFGLWLIALMPGWLHAGWLHLKLGLVLLLLAFHGYLGWLLRAFRRGKNRHSPLFYRWLNEVPTVFLILIILLAVAKPF